MARLIRLVLAALLAISAERVSAGAAADPLAGLDAAVEAARVQWHAPGIAVAIVKDDRLVYAKGS